MRIGILSMQRVKNYGSVLQAYALKKILEGLGHQVDFIDIEKGDIEDLNIQCVICGKETKINNVDKCIKEVLLRKIDNVSWSLQMIYIFRQFRVRFLNIYSKPNKQYDVCIIGSDEVFNCMQKSKWGFSPQLFGNVKNADKIITYAACSGGTDPTMLSEDLKLAIKKAMVNLKSISVRDDNTAIFVNDITGRECEFHFDPVLISDFNNEVEFSGSVKLPERYCIVYSYENRISDKSEIEAIINYCKEKKLEIITPFGRQFWVKNKYKVFTPFELLKVFKCAECVITDTFHGTIFSVKFSRKLAIIIRNSNRNKLGDLVKRLRIENHVVSEIGELDEVLKININKERVNTIIQKEKNNTMEYLKRNLSDNNGI